MPDDRWKRRRDLGASRFVSIDESIIMSLASKLLNQVRNPTGWLGRWNLRGMNRRHSKLTDWGLKHVSIDSDAAILDIGCGGGRTIHKLAAVATKGKVYGVDSSETSVAASRKTNEECIKSRRVEILHGSVSHLPFPDQMFALATAVETHFYWPDLRADIPRRFRPPIRHRRGFSRTGRPRRHACKKARLAWLRRGAARGGPSGAFPDPVADAALRRCRPQRRRRGRGAFG